MSPLTTPINLTTSRRQAVFYALLYCGTGASLPFMPLWLKTHGMTAAQIGIILAVPLLLRAVSGPISGLWADSFRLYRTPLFLLSLSGACFYALMSIGTVFPPLRFGAYLVLFTLGYTCMANLAPLTDAMTLHLARLENFAYAIPRAIGSSAFIATNIGLGWILLVLPSDSILVWLVVAGTLTALGGRYLLGEQARQVLPHADQPRQNGWQRVQVLLRDEGFLWLMLAIGCMQAAHSFYYAFSTIIWKERGLSSSTCGYLWAIGVVAEVAFMWLGEGFRRKVGPWRMLILAGMFSVIRWGVMALSPPVWMLYPLQVLHAFSFAAAYLAGLQLVHRLTPKGYESLAQTMNSAYASGVMMGIGTLVSGAIYQAFAARGYGIMAAVSCVGLLSAIWIYTQRERLAAAVDHGV